MPQPVRTCFFRPLTSFAIALLATIAAHADDWQQWRGPTGDNHAAAGAIAPTTWGENESILWRTAIPGRGHASPTLVGNRIYLATAIPRQQAQLLLIYDRASGEFLKRTVCHQGGFERGLHPNNTYASQTVASDGQRVFLVFCNQGKVWATAADLEGKILWQQSIGPYEPKRFGFGYGTSPIVIDGKVIVTSEFDGPGSTVVALDAATGRELWRTARPKHLSYSPPARWPTAGGEQLLMSGNFLVAAYDPANGKQMWSVPAPWQATCGTMVWDEVSGLGFASGGGGINTRNATIAVSLSGDPRIVWDNTVKCYESSLLVVNGYLYGVSDGTGVVYCWRCRDGQEMWKHRLGGGACSASPLLVDGKIYLTNERGTTFVFAATPEGYQQLAKNQLGSDGFPTPTPADGRLYVRYGDDSSGERQEFLVAIGER